MLQLLRAPLVIVHVALLCWIGAAVDQAAEELEQQQNEYACRLYYDDDLVNQFQASIYGNASRRDLFVHGVSLNWDDTVKCRAKSSCPDAPVLWCVHLYNPQQPIKLCLNSTGHVTYITEAAALLRLQDMFQIREEDCIRSATYTRPGPGCLSVLSVKFFIYNAYLSCTVQNDTCYRKTYTDLFVLGSGEHSPNPTVEFDSKPDLLLNKTNIFLCNASVSAEDAGNSAFRGGWIVNGEPVGQRIYRNPYCETDPSVNREECRDSIPAVKDRVRVYTILYQFETCPFKTLLRKNWLVIENATLEDAAKTYQCSGNYVVTNPGNAAVTKIKNFDVHPVYQLSEVVTPPNSSNVSFHLKSDETVQWSCSVKAGVGDRLVWTLNEKKLLTVDISDLTNFTLTQEDSIKNINCSLVKYLGDSFVVTETKELGEFKRQFTSTLFICRVTELTAGLYECVVNRSRGPSAKVELWSAEVFYESSTPSKPQTREVSTLLPVFITVSVIASLVVVVLFVTILSLCVRHQRKKKQQRHDIIWESAMGNMSVTNDILVEFRRNNSLKKDAVGPSLMSEPDPLEFPRNKLILLDRILGEGTFGVVRQAKAEGIVESTPERNIVAVKTAKAKAPPHEINNFWEELQLMKTMPPHGNIVNLLGYCTTPGCPVYMIIEYANHGSLKDFLKACEDAVLKLNHVPQVQTLFRSHRASSTNSGSSSYPHLVYKMPVSAQNSVFSTVGTPTGIITAANSSSKFEFSPAVDRLTRDRLVTQDSGFFGENIDNSSQATFNGLTGSRSSNAHSVAPLTHDYVNSKGLLYMEDVQNFALQIACGLKHLEDIQIVHCDLAARNILIAEGFVLKIGDFGMARDVSEKEYYRKHGGRVPVKWTAPEALKDHIFTFKSDIWSFGVILWEIFTYGQQPYPKFKIRHSWDPFIHYIMEGNRLSQPVGCPDNFFDLMQCCWDSSPDQRPSAEELVQVFSQTHLLYDNMTGSSDSSTLQSDESSRNDYVTRRETQV